MHVGLFGEANTQVGAGHVMRLVALGQTAEALGHQVTYFGSCPEIPWVRSLVRKWRPMSEASSALDWIVADSYDSDELKACSRVMRSSRMAVIIDSATPHIPADLYVAPGLLEAERQEAAKAAGRLVEGVPYLLIRGEFRGRVHKPNRRDPYVLVTLGGSAVEREAGLVVSSLRSAGWMGRVVVLTPDGSWSDDLDSRTEILPTGFLLPRLAQACTFAISASGVTVWELLSMGVPTGAVCLSIDQIMNYEWVTERQVAVALGRFDKGAPFQTDFFLSAVESPSFRRDLSARARKIVDGEGPDRIISLMHHF